VSTGYQWFALGVGFVYGLVVGSILTIGLIGW
jgi:hypothetical protein